MSPPFSPRERKTSPAKADKESKSDGSSRGTDLCSGIKVSATILHLAYKVMLFLL